MNDYKARRHAVEILDVTDHTLNDDRGDQILCSPVHAERSSSSMENEKRDDCESEKDPHCDAVNARNCCDVEGKTFDIFVTTVWTSSRNDRSCEQRECRDNNEDAAKNARVARNDR